MTTDDFEFELLVPPGWMDRWGQGGLSSSSSGIFAHALNDGYPPEWAAARQARSMRPWYAPKPIDAYEVYSDFTSVGYLHVLVDRERTGDRRRVFVSKH